MLIFIMLLHVVVNCYFIRMSQCTNVMLYDICCMSLVNEKFEDLYIYGNNLRNNFMYSCIHCAMNTPISHLMQSKALVMLLKLPVKFEFFDL